MSSNTILSTTKKLFCLLSISITSNIYSMTMGKSLMIPQSLGDVSVHYKDNEFFVEKESELKPIHRWNVEKSLRGIPKDRLVKLLAAGGYLQLNKYENCDEYNLKLRGRLNGGGIITANAFYWTTKGLIYGVGLLGLKKCISDCPEPIKFGGEIAFDAAELNKSTEIGLKIAEKVTDEDTAKQTFVAGMVSWGVEAVGVVESVAMSAFYFGLGLPTP